MGQFLFDRLNRRPKNKRRPLAYRSIDRYKLTQMQITDTRTAILDVTEELFPHARFQRLGVKDLAEQVEIRTSSIHYHFPTKADLCRALISRHRQRVAGSARGDRPSRWPIRGRSSSGSPAMFQSTIEAGNRMCPFGMLAADSETLESGSCDELRESFSDLESWLRRVLLEGRKAGMLAYNGSAAARGSSDPLDLRGGDAGGADLRRPRALRGGRELPAREVEEVMKSARVLVCRPLSSIPPSAWISIKKEPRCTLR